MELNWGILWWGKLCSFSQHTHNSCDHRRECLCVYHIAIVWSTLTSFLSESLQVCTSTMASVYGFMAAAVFCPIYDGRMKLQFMAAWGRKPWIVRELITHTSQTLTATFARRELSRRKMWTKKSPWKQNQLKTLSVEASTSPHHITHRLLTTHECGSSLKLLLAHLRNHERL